MPASKKSFAKLLLIKALYNTSKENPKNSKMLISEINNEWQRLYNGEEESISEQTILRYVHDIRLSGLFNITTCKDAKNGYYRSNSLLNTAEISIIAQALYRSNTLSPQETVDILSKISDVADTSGKKQLTFLRRVIKNFSPKRKNMREIIPIIANIIAAIQKKRVLEFTYYRYSKTDVGNMEKYTDKDGNPKKYQVSPYFLVWNSDTFYLICHYHGHDKENTKYLSHFNVSLIAAKPFIKEFAEYVPITKIKEYPLYTPKNLLRTYETVSKDLLKFSIDDYMREHLYMFNNGTESIEMCIEFADNMLGVILNQFSINPNLISAYPTGKLNSKNRTIYRATVNVQENDGLYLWLMKQGNNIMVVSPDKIRVELKRRFLEAVRAIDEFDNNKG